MHCYGDSPHSIVCRCCMCPFAFFCLPMPTHPVAISVSIRLRCLCVCCRWSTSTAIMVFVLASVFQIISRLSSVPQPLMLRLTTSPCSFSHVTSGGCLYHKSLPITLIFASVLVVCSSFPHNTRLLCHLASPRSTELALFFPLLASLVCVGRV